MNRTLFEKCKSLISFDRDCRQRFLDSIKFPRKEEPKEDVTVIVEPTPKKLDIDFHDFTMLGLQKLADRNGIVYYVKSTKEQLIALLKEYNERGELHHN